MESFLPKESVEILSVKSFFRAVSVITRTLLLGGAFGLREKLIIVNLKPNLQSVIELKVLSTKELLFKTETIDKCMKTSDLRDQ